MKKLVIGVFVVVLLLILATSVASADKPPGVGPAERDQYSFQSAGYKDGRIIDCLYADSCYDGTCFIQYSNGATDQSTLKCKYDLLWGDPVYDYFAYNQVYSWGWVSQTWSFEGKKFIYNHQCSGCVY